MIYVIKDVKKVKDLLKDSKFDRLTTCLNRSVKIYAVDRENPKSIMLLLGGDEAYFFGVPCRELVMRKTKKWIGMFPTDKEWEKLMEECYPEADIYTRYAIKDGVFDKAKLESMARVIPEGYELKKIDSKVYDLCSEVEDDDVSELIDWFNSKREFLKLGKGYAIIKDGKVVGGASTAYRFEKGIELEVDVLESERKKGLATVACATMILDCLNEGLEPTWDAANLISVHLAEKLGFSLDHEYKCFEVSPIFHQTIKNPDKSKWEEYCGEYEMNFEKFKLEKVWMENGDLFGKASNEIYKDFTFKFYPIGENKFGRKNGIAKITFYDGYLEIDGIRCNKIKK